MAASDQKHSTSTRNGVATQNRPGDVLGIGVLHAAAPYHRVDLWSVHQNRLFPRIEIP